MSQSITEGVKGVWCIYGVWNKELTKINCSWGTSMETLVGISVIRVIVIIWIQCELVFSPQGKSNMTHLFIRNSSSYTLAATYNQEGLTHLRVDLYKHTYWKQVAAIQRCKCAKIAANILKMGLLKAMLTSSITPWKLRQEVCSEIHFHLVQLVLTFPISSATSEKLLGFEENPTLAQKISGPGQILERCSAAHWEWSDRKSCESGHLWHTVRGGRIVLHQVVAGLNGNLRLSKCW